MKNLLVIILFLSSLSIIVRAETKLGIKHGIHKVKNTEAHVFEIPADLFSIQPVKALNVGIGTETVSHIAKRTGANLAINGGFFDTFPEYEGIPSGVYKLKDEWLSIGEKSRAALGIKDNQLFWGRIKVSAFAKVGEKVYTIHGINRPPKAQENILYTPSFNTSTLTHTDRVELSVSEGQIAHISQRGDVSIPHNGYVLSLPQQHIPSSFGPGTKAHITHSTEADTDSTPWKEMDFIVSGTPLLILNGKLISDYTSEDVQKDFVTQKFARTAIGVKKDGTVVVVVAGHIHPYHKETIRKMPLEDVGHALLGLGYSRLEIKKMTLDEILSALEKCNKDDQLMGLTITELAEFMLSLGITNAINLSGGNSTNVYFEGKSLPMHGINTVNKEKKVSDAIIFSEKVMR